MKKLLFFALLLILAFNPAITRDVKGVNMPDNLKLGNVNLILNGAGVIKKFFFKVYAIGLYTDQKIQDENILLNQDRPYIIRMHFIHNDISPDKIIESWNTGFSKATDGNTDPIKNEIRQFNSYFNFEVMENDIFQFEYTPGTGTKVLINNKLKGTIGGFPFRRALLGIWLGKEPRDKGVKEKLLGIE